MHTGNLLGGSLPLPSGVFADLVTQQCSYRAHSPQGSRPLPESGSIRMNTNGYCWCREAILVFITPDTRGTGTRPSGAGGLHLIPAHLPAPGGVDYPTETTVWLCVYY